MSPLERYADEFCRVARQQLEQDLGEFGHGVLLSLLTSDDGAGMWATANISLVGHAQPWEFRRLVLERAQFQSSATVEHATGEATIFSTLLMETLDTQPWPPVNSRPVDLVKLPPDPPGSVEAWPGGPHRRLLGPASLRARHVDYINALHVATWKPLHDAIAKDPWIGLKPEFLEEDDGIWLQMSMRRIAAGCETRWQYRELVIGHGGSSATADDLGRQYVDRAIADFASRQHDLP